MNIQEITTMAVTKKTAEYGFHALRLVEITFIAEVTDRLDTYHQIARGADGITYCRLQEDASHPARRPISTWQPVNGNPGVMAEVERIANY